MESTFDIELDEISSKFSSFYKILERLPEFTQFRREIKLNTLLSNTRLQFDVDDINMGYGTSALYGKMGLPDPETHLSDISFKVSSMSFIIKGDIINKLSITINTLDNENGTVLSNILLNDIIVLLKIKYIDGEIPSHGNFYIDI